MVLWLYDCSFVELPTRPESLKVSPLHRLQWSLTCFSPPWSWPTIKLELSTSTQPEMTPITSSGWFKCVIFFFTIHLCHVRLKICIVFCFCPPNIWHPSKNWMSLLLVAVLQRPVENDPHGQHRSPAHPGAHGAVWIWEVSLQRSFLQDAHQVPVHLHERFHR